MDKLTVNIILFGKFIGFLFYFLDKLVLPSFAQIAQDGTTSTTVDHNGNNFTINYGDQAGSNLFHSFKDFSVPTGGEAFFNNAQDIANIFSRITGEKTSIIDGLISAKGAANLFLINPNGIIFGENARLNLGGSFFASTADSLLFAGNKEFSANNLQAAPLLEVNIPIGLTFRANPEDIKVQGANLAVDSNQTLALIGGNININKGRLTALGGQIELGGLSDAGTINIDELGENLSIKVPKSITRGDISINNDTTIITRARSGGFISFQAKNLTISSAEVLSQSSSRSQSQGGNIEIDATESVIVSDDSKLDSSSLNIGDAGNITINAIDHVTVNNSSLSSNSNNQGRAGNIDISSESVIVSDDSKLDSSSGNIGDAGNITINAIDHVTIDNSSLSSNSNNQGRAGNIDISSESESVTLRNSSQLNSSSGNIGDAGDISINATNNVIIDSSSLFSTSDDQGQGGNIDISSENFDMNNKSVISAITNGDGDAGDIHIQVTSISLNNTSLILNRTLGEGDAGDVKIQAQSVELLNGSGIQSSTFNGGNAGNIQINADNSIVISGVAEAEIIKLASDEEQIGGFSSGLISTSNLKASEQGRTSGSGGTITVITGHLEISNGATLSGRTRSNASGGNIIVNANTIDLTVGGQILTAAFDQGNAGNITLNVTEGINISGSDPDFFSRQQQVMRLAKNLNTDPELIIDPVSQESGVFANTISGSQGDGGNISIGILNSEEVLNTSQFTKKITLSNQGKITANSEGTGRGGTITIRVEDLNLDQGEISATTNMEQEEASSFLSTINLFVEDDLIVRNNSQISAQATNNADGGNVNIDAEFIIAYPPKEFDGSDILANAAEEGQGGKINITAESLFGIEERPQNSFTNDIDASSEFGLQGNVSINTPEVEPTSGLIELPEAVGDVTEQISQNICEQGVGSEFIITGKGGLPPNPHETLNSDEDLVELVPLMRTVGANGIRPNNLSPEKSTPELVPARGWIFNDKGEVTLTSYKTHDTEIKRSPQQKFNGCSTSILENN